jgi:8-oxo-dGTP pyrophosphatase MutT (NUDIX family)
MNSSVSILWQRVGITLFWIAWPISWMNLRGSMRTRLLIVNGNYLIVTKRWIGEGKWSLPGGGLHKEEESLSGAIRELHEETKLQLTGDKLTRDSDRIYQYHGFRFNYVLFTGSVKQKLHLQHQLFELTDARWIHHKELSSKNALPDVVEAIRSWWG